MLVGTIQRGWHRSGALPGLALLALIYTLLNGFKPLHIDDAAYYYYAAQVAKHPLDPYGFKIFWYQSSQPAFQVLAPPVLPYWWACAIRLFGDRPVCWKLWLLPFCALFVLALHGLFRKFAAGLEGPLTWMTVLSPTFLPSLNLMLDVPSLALRLFSILFFIKASDRGSPRLALVAGLVGGLAMETKYTGVLGPVAILLYAALAQKPRLGLIAVSAAASVFVSWESWIALRYGQSHFLYHLRTYEAMPSLDETVEALPRMLGGLAPYVTLLGLIALGLPKPVLIPSATVLAMPYILLVWAPAGGPSPSFLFGFFGLVQYATLLAAVTWRLGGGAGGREPSPVAERRAIWFLVLWMVLEVAGYVVLTPFLAVRRVMGVTVLATLLAGHLAVLFGRESGQTGTVRGVAVGGVALGLLFYSVDLRDAIAHRQAAERAAAWLQRHGGGTSWFVGHWGFQFYAERAGMRPALPATSRLRRGDWLAVPSQPVDQQVMPIGHRSMRLVHTIHIRDPIHLRTVPGYYGAQSSTILEHHRGPRVSVDIYEKL